VALLLAWAAAPVGAASTQQERRNRFGHRLFRALLVADQGVAARALPDGRLPIAVYYADDPEQAAEQLEGIARRDESGEPEPIQDLPLALELTDDAGFGAWGEHAPAGIFITQDPGEDTLARIVRYGIEHGVVVYSPFEGHVERGVLGGLSVEATVKPYVNRETLAASRIELKEFFVRISRLHP
jgi:hypothetical protein